MQPTAETKPKFRLPVTVKMALLFFLLAGNVVVTILPRLYSQSQSVLPFQSAGSTGVSTPPLAVFMATGLAMVLITAAFFAFLNNLKLGFKSTALALAFGYSSVIAVIKFILSPKAMYDQGTIDGTYGDPNGARYQLTIALVMLLLYTLVFYIVYRVSARRVERAIAGEKPPRRHLFLKMLPVLIGLIILACVLTGGAVLIIGLMVLGAPLNYLSIEFGTVAVPLFVAIALGVWLAVRSFQTVAEEAIVTRNSTLLASFFWIGLSLIMIYHVLWVVFLLTLVHIWPFNTYTPK